MFSKNRIFSQIIIEIFKDTFGLAQLIRMELTIGTRPGFNGQEGRLKSLTHFNEKTDNAISLAIRNFFNELMIRQNQTVQNAQNDFLDYTANKLKNMTHQYDSFIQIVQK